MTSSFIDMKGNVKTYKATIKYAIDLTHPDIEYIKDWAEDKAFSYSDTYYFDENFYLQDESDLMEYIKEDLMLIAGGGYNADHIHNVKFTIKRI